MTRIALVLLFSYFLRACSNSSHSAHKHHGAGNHNNVVHDSTYYAPRYYPYYSSIHRFPNRKPRYYSSGYRNKHKHKTKPKHIRKIKRSHHKSNHRKKSVIKHRKIIKNKHVKGNKGRGAKRQLRNNKTVERSSKVQRPARHKRVRGSYSKRFKKRLIPIYN